MSAQYTVIAHFLDIDSTKNAISKLRDVGYEDLELFSPFPCHDLDDEMYRGKKRSPVRRFTFYSYPDFTKGRVLAGKKRSPVRRFTLLGALLGCFGAFLMTSWMSVDWPIRTSAKPLISVPAFVVIAFECTILLGAIFTLLSMFHFSRIPCLFKNPSFRPQFSEGTFGLAVRVDKEKTGGLEEVLKQLGAKEVELQYVR